MKKKKHSLASEQRGMVSLTGSTIQFFRLGPLPYLGSVELVKINSVHLSRRKWGERKHKGKGKKKTASTVATAKKKKKKLSLSQTRPRIELIKLGSTALPAFVGAGPSGITCFFE